jgi:hypothetical protein
VDLYIHSPIRLGTALSYFLPKQSGLTVLPLQDSSVSVVAGYRLDGLVSIPSRDKFSFSMVPRPAVGPTQQPTPYAVG